MALSAPSVPLPPAMLSVGVDVSTSGVGRLTTTRYARVVSPSAAVTVTVAVVSPTATLTWCPAVDESASVDGVYASEASSSFSVPESVTRSVAAATVAV